MENPGEILSCHTTKQNVNSLNESELDEHSVVKESLTTAATGKSNRLKLAPFSVVTHFATTGLDSGIYLSPFVAFLATVRSGMTHSKHILDMTGKEQGQ